jgi:hypothetical protein
MGHSRRFWHVCVMSFATRYDKLAANHLAFIKLASLPWATRE